MMQPRRQEQLWEPGGALLRTVHLLPLVLHGQVGVTALPAYRTPVWKWLYAISADDAPPRWAEAMRRRAPHSSHQGELMTLNHHLLSLAFDS